MRSLRATSSWQQAGITTCLHASASETELAALAALADRGPLPVRPHVALTVEAEEAADPATMLARVADLRSTYARPGVEIDNLKLFFDGVIEYPTQTAALLKPYRVNKGTKDDPRWVRGKDRGPTYWKPGVAGPAVAAADAAGWQVHVHAIGDRAVRSALDAFEGAIAANGRTDDRHTITHLELVDPKDFPRFGKLGVLASMQMQWAERDSYTVERLRDYLGRKRWRNTYPAGSLRKAGALLCGGSDWPVDPLLPFRQIEMAVNRTADEVYAGDPKPLFRGQGIKLRAVARDAHPKLGLSAASRGPERPAVPGLAADLVVADRDLLDVPLRKVSKAKALLTMVDGRIVHRCSRDLGRGLSARALRGRRDRSASCRHLDVGSAAPPCSGRRPSGRRRARRPPRPSSARPVVARADALLLELAHVPVLLVDHVPEADRVARGRSRHGPSSPARRTTRR